MIRSGDSFLKSLLLILLIKVSHSLLLGIVISNNLFKIKEVISTEISLTSNYGLLISISLIVFVGPIVEEIAFRGWISDNQKSIKYSLPILYLYTIVFFYGFLFNESWQHKYFIGVIVTGFLVVFSWNRIDRLLVFVKENKKLLTSISIGYFTVIHLFNYQVNELDYNKIIALAILGLPYPFMAHVLTTLRVRKGLFWSILLHISSNSLIILPILFGNLKP